MSVLADGNEFLDGLSRLSGQQWFFRAVVPVATVGVVALEMLAGGSFHPGFTILAVALSVLVALVPDSAAPLFLVMLLGVHWAMTVPESLSGWVLLAALAFLVIHVAAGMASYGPPSLVLEPALLLLWLNRCGVVAAVTALTWLVARLFSGLGLLGSGWALGAALLLAVAWAGHLARSLTPSRGGPRG